MNAFLFWGNLLFSGFVAISISVFFAEGAIGENYTNERFVESGFLWLIPLWVAAAILITIYFYKHKAGKLSYSTIFLLNTAIWVQILFCTWIFLKWIV